MIQNIFLKNKHVLRLKAAMFFLCFFLMIHASGCVFVAGGIAGVAGGYMLTRDTISGEYGVKYKQAWRASIDACSTLGEVTEQDSDDGIILATIDRVKVRVMVSELSDKSVTIKVKARKAFFPQMGTAEKVFARIAQKLVR
ncbi:MAG: DUF3568 family protein [Candidatus Omnitrophota bacterium]